MLASLIAIALGPAKFDESSFFEFVRTATQEQIEQKFNLGRRSTWRAIAPESGFSLVELVSNLEPEVWPLDFVAYQNQGSRRPTQYPFGLRSISITWDGPNLVAATFSLECEDEVFLDVPTSDLERLGLPMPTVGLKRAYEAPRIGGSSIIYYYKFAFEDPQTEGEIWHAVYTFTHRPTGIAENGRPEPTTVSGEICISRVDWIRDLAMPNVSEFGPYRYIPRLVRVSTPSTYTIPLSKAVTVNVNFPAQTTFEQAAEFLGLGSLDYVVLRSSERYVTASPSVQPLASARFPFSYFSEALNQHVEGVNEYRFRWAREFNDRGRFTLEASSAD